MSLRLVQHLPHTRKTPATQSGPLVTCICLACDRLAQAGYWIGRGPDFICEECTGALAYAYGAAHGLDMGEPPGPDEVRVRLLFAPQEGPASLDADITPEQPDPASEIAIFEQATDGLLAYLAHYRAAMLADASLEEREDQRP